MNHSLIIGSISVCAVALYGFFDFEIFSYFTASSQDMPVNSCDRISKLVSDFNCFIGSLDKETDISTNNPINSFDKASEDSWDYFKGITPLINNDTKELVDYWLRGTATESNWFDKACNHGWDYLKNICSTAPVINNGGANKELVLTTNNDGAYKELVVTSKSQANYLVLGLGCLLVGCAIFADLHYNFDMFKAAYTIIDQRFYDILCMFDFPGFMVDRTSVMPLGGGFDLRVSHTWRFYTDPADNRLGLTHLATYTLDHEYFWFDFNSLPPAWSVPSYLTLTIVPGLQWPFNYDHFHYINLFSCL